MYKVIILLLMGLFVSCKTVVQLSREPFPVIAIENYVGNDTYIITVNVKTSGKVGAKEYFYKKVDEILQKKGYARYEILEMRTKDKRGLTDFGKDPDVKERIYGKIKFYND